MPNLFSLFDDRLKNDRDLVASEPQTLETIAAEQEEQERIITKIKRFQDVEPKIDYTDFSNFVFFNSALDYFNITGEKILNEYPYDGSVSDIENYIHALDGYQRHVLSTWPSRCGHLRFNPTSGFAYVQVQDVGVQDNVARSSFIAPGTGSFSLEFWINTPAALTGTNDIMVIAQKVTGSNGDGFTAYLTGSQVGFRVVSGTVTNEVFVPFVGGQDSYFACVMDRSASPVLIMMTGSSTTFPVVVNSASCGIASALYIGPTYFTMASGTMAGKVVRPYTGSMDQVTAWQTNLSVFDVTGSFNTKTYAQKDLLGVWRFNESGSILNDTTTNSIVLDGSGHKLNGYIRNYYTAIRGSGSLGRFDKPEPILFFSAPEVQSLISLNQSSASFYDRSNDNIITEMLPDNFFELEAQVGTEVLQNFLWILARNFDFIKQRIDQFVKIMRSNYGQYDQTPDALLADIGRFFGWEFTGNFLNADAASYILGKNVLQNLDANVEIDTKLFEIKNEFWKRVLINLMYLYKTKGTRESVESLLRVYGVNKHFVRLKEYGYKPNVGLQTFRINAEKSTYALGFGSGSYTGSLSSSFFTSFADSVETSIRFPTQTTTDMTASISTGSIWNLSVVTSPSGALQLYYTKSVPSSLTGNIILSSSEGIVTLANVPIFDDNWYHVAVTRNVVSGTLGIYVRSIDVDTIDFAASASISASITTSSRSWIFTGGSVAGTSSQHWAHEMRVWDKVLTPSEMDDHALNYQSYGVDDVTGIGKVALHWRLWEGVTGSINNTLSPIYEVSGKQGTVGSSGWKVGIQPFKRFLFDYNYLASTDFGWNEEKIRVYAGSEVKPQDAFSDNPMVALEFNMVDALNEDISQVLSTIDSFNNAIGLPMNRFRGTYDDLNKLRRQYFSVLQGRLNFRVFSDMLEFFDRSFIDIVRKIIPARTVFIGDEFVVESHMLERPKLQWNYRRQPPQFQPEGSITIFSRD